MTTINVSAGEPGKIRIVIDGAEFTLNHDAALYTGLHDLAEAVNAAAAPAAPSAPPTTPDVGSEP